MRWISGERPAEGSRSYEDAGMVVDVDADHVYTHYGFLHIQYQ